MYTQYASFSTKIRLLLLCISVTFVACGDEITPNDEVIMDDMNVDMLVQNNDFTMTDQNMIPEDMNSNPVDQETLDMEMESPWCSRCGEDVSCAEGFVCQAHQGFSFCTQTCEQDDMCPEEYHCVTADLSDAQASGGEEAGMEIGGNDEAQGPKVCIPISNQCDSKLCRDEDGDGYGVGPDCLGLDCDEESTEIHAGVTEDLCDNVDNDCDGNTDESFVSTACEMGACSGQTQCMAGVITCEGAADAGLDNTCDGVDEDCDGNVDEGYLATPCGFGTCQQMSVCQMGEETCTPLMPSANETDALCDGLDNDCDQVVDEGYRGNTCGVGACVSVGICNEQGQEICLPVDPIGEDDNCNGIDDDCDGSTDESYVEDMSISCGVGACVSYQACTQGEVACVPGQPSLDDDNCNGIDDDCNGIIDDTCADNILSFEIVSQAPDHMVVAIRLSRGEETEVNYDTLPRSLELRFQFDARLSASQIRLGQIPTTLGFTQNPSDYDRRPDFIRVAFPGLGDQVDQYQGLLAGEFITIRFDHDPDESGPFNFTWIHPEPCEDLNQNQVCEDLSEPFTDVNNNEQHDANTNVVPQEANAILQLIDASLGE